MESPEHKNQDKNIFATPPENVDTITDEHIDAVNSRIFPKIESPNLSGCSIAEGASRQIRHMLRYVQRIDQRSSLSEYSYYMLYLGYHITETKSPDPTFLEKRDEIGRHINRLPINSTIKQNLLNKINELQDNGIEGDDRAVTEVILPKTKEFLQRHPIVLRQYLNTKYGLIGSHSRFIGAILRKDMDSLWEEMFGFIENPNDENDPRLKNLIATIDARMQDMVILESKIQALPSITSNRPTSSHVEQQALLNTTIEVWKLIEKIYTASHAISDRSPEIAKDLYLQLLGHADSVTHKQTLDFWVELPPLYSMIQYKYSRQELRDFGNTIHTIINKLNSLKAEIQ